MLMILPGGATEQRYSPLANELAFLDNSGAGIIDMTTGTITEIGPNLKADLGDSLVPWFIQAVDWSPYDNRLLVVMAANAWHDTLNNGRTVMLFLHNDGSLDTQFVGDWLGHSQYLLWLCDSHPSVDSLVFAYAPTDTQVSIYCPESHSFTLQKDAGIMRESPSGKHTFGTWSGSYFLDGNVINWGNQNPIYVRSVSFSPDEKHIAFAVGQLGSVEWIYNVSDLLSGKPVAPIAQLNFMPRYCLGSVLGAWGEFVSDTSLVVSLHADPTTGAQCNLYEVNFNGDIIRQLTHY